MLEFCWGEKEESTWQEKLATVFQPAQYNQIFSTYIKPFF